MKDKMHLDVWGTRLEVLGKLDKVRRNTIDDQLGDLGGDEKFGQGLLVFGADDSWHLQDWLALIDRGGSDAFPIGMTNDQHLLELLGEFVDVRGGEAGRKACHL